MTLEKIREECVEGATKHLSATLEGNFKVGNKQHSKLMKLYEKVKVLEQQQLFLDFLTNPNEGVRLWAATFLLTTHPKPAIDCLNQLKKLPTITSLDAEMVLTQWQKGELELLWVLGLPKLMASERKAAHNNSFYAIVAVGMDLNGISLIGQGKAIYFHDFFDTSSAFEAN